jgi:hypothetical protein
VHAPLRSPPQGGAFNFNFSKKIKIKTKQKLTRLGLITLGGGMVSGAVWYQGRGGGILPR